MTEPVAQWLESAGVHGLRLLVIVAIVVLAVRLLRAATTRLVERAKNQTRVAQVREQQTRTMAGVLYSMGFGVIVIVGLLAALPEFGFNVTPVAAAAGLASLAIGFGGQYLVKDLINGFFIIFEDQYGVGDVIRVNNDTGRVEHVTVRRTVMRNDRGAVISIPNGLIGSIANLSRDWSQTYVDVTVPSGETVGRALAILEKVCGDFRSDAEWSNALIDGPRVLGIESLNLDGTALRIQLRSAALRADDVARELRRRVKSAFEQAQILISNTQPVELIGRAASAGSS
ncbi:MAG: mechanosensitive ion channel family protein [Candidatus Acidiferrales bacterium]